MAPRYARHPSVQVRVDGDGAVLLHLVSHEYFELNHTAFLLWGLLDAHPTAEDLTRALVADHGVAPSEAATFVTEWLRELVDAELITRDGAPRRRDRWLRKLGLGR